MPQQVDASLVELANKQDIRIDSFGKSGIMGLAKDDTNTQKVKNTVVVNQNQNNEECALRSNRSKKSSSHRQPEIAPAKAQSPAKEEKKVSSEKPDIIVEEAKSKNIELKIQNEESKFEKVLFLEVF